MRITICGSIQHLQAMVNTKNILTKNGVDVVLPHNAEAFLKDADFSETKSIYLKNPIPGVPYKDEIGALMPIIVEDLSTFPH